MHASTCVRVQLAHARASATELTASIEKAIHDLHSEFMRGQHPSIFADDSHPIQVASRPTAFPTRWWFASMPSLSRPIERLRLHSLALMIGGCFPRFGYISCATMKVVILCGSFPWTSGTQRSCALGKGSRHEHLRGSRSGERDQACWYDLMVACVASNPSVLQSKWLAEIKSSFRGEWHTCDRRGQAAT